jgi:hypothetical protein
MKSPHHDSIESPFQQWLVDCGRCPSRLCSDFEPKILDGHHVHNPFKVSLLGNTGNQMVCYLLSHTKELYTFSDYQLDEGRSTPTAFNLHYDGGFLSDFIKTLLPLLLNSPLNCSSW